MALYNVYAGDNGRMVRVYSFTATDDVAAKQFVRERLTDEPIELWCYSKRVARFERRGPSRE